MGSVSEMHLATSRHPGASLARTEVLLASEVAEKLRVPISTVYDLARRKVLPGHRVGRAWRFIGPEIEEWLQRN
jgi:excisionase family DNA binding protein